MSSADSFLHTATRLASPLIDRVRRVNPDAALAAYGLYAPINDTWLRSKGIAHVLVASPLTVIALLLPSQADLRRLERPPRAA